MPIAATSCSGNRAARGVAALALAAGAGLAAVLVGCSAPQSPRPPVEAISCRDWMNLPRTTRVEVMARRLQSQITEPQASAAPAACLAALSQPTAERLYADCLRADATYSVASQRAIDAATVFCRSRESGPAP